MPTRAVLRRIGEKIIAEVIRQFLADTRRDGEQTDENIFRQNRLTVHVVMRILSFVGSDRHEIIKRQNFSHQRSGGAVLEIHSLAKSKNGSVYLSYEFNHRILIHTNGSTTSFGEKEASRDVLVFKGALPG